MESTNLMHTNAKLFQVKTITDYALDKLFPSISVQ